MPKILYINPVGTKAFDEPLEKYLNRFRRPETVIKVTSLSKGPEHLEYYSYDALVVPEILRLVRRAEDRGFDAVIIGCFYDPGIHEAREVSRIVVTAPCESSLHIASMLGDSFSIIVGRRKWIPIVMRNVINYGLRDKLHSIKAIGLGVHDLHRDEDDTRRRLIRVAREAVEEGSEVIILGCTIFYGFFRELQRAVGVPVIDPVIAALKQAEMLVEARRLAGWGHSKVYGYESPPQEEVRCWGLNI